MGGPCEQAVRTQTVQVHGPGRAPDESGTPGQWRVLAPVTERGEVIGLLEFLTPGEPQPHRVGEIARLAHLLAFVVIANRRHSDLFQWGQRTRPLSLSAEIQHRLLPGPQACEAGAFTLAGWLEPAAVIAGDTFDFSLGRDVLHLSLTDAMGTASTRTGCCPGYSGALAGRGCPRPGGPNCTGAHPCPGTGGCGRVARKYQPLEEWVIGQWADHMTRLTGSEYWSAEEDLTAPDEAAVDAEEEEVTRRIGTLRDRWAAGQVGDEDFFPLIEQLRARLAEIDRERMPHKPLIVRGQTVTGLTFRVAWRQGLEFVGDMSGRDNQQRGIAAQREMLAQQIEKITVGPVTRRGSHTFDPSTVSITWRTPVGGERAAAPARLVGPRIQLEIRGRPSPQPAGEPDA